MIRLRVATLSTMFFCIAGQQVSANSMMAHLFRPIRPGTNYFIGIDARESESQGSGEDKLSLQDYGITLMAISAGDESRQMMYSLRYGGLDLSRDLTLPDTGIAISDTLEDVVIGLGCRRARDGDMYGWFGYVGSASDRPFDSFHEVSVMFNAFYNRRVTRAGSWLYLLNYSNRRSFLTDIPIPGIAYAYVPDNRTTIVAGAPFLMLQYPLGEAFSVDMRYFVPDMIKLDAIIRVHRNMAFFAGLERDEESYFLSEREERRRRLYYQENRFYGGVRFSPGRATSLEVMGGYATDRRFFQSRTRSGSDRDRVDLDNAAYLGIRLSQYL